MVETGAPSFDAIVVGSGFAGAWAAKEFTEAGFRALVIEAGPPRTHDEVADRQPSANPFATIQHVRINAPNQTIQRCHSGFASRGAHLFVNDDEQPYETPPGHPYYWIRGMQVGGRSLMWGGTALRLSRFETEAAALHGCTLRWPLKYEELRQWYSSVEEHLALCGSTDGLPQLPDSHYSHRPGRLTQAEQDFQRAWHLPGTRAVPVRVVRSARGHNGWPSLTMQATALAAANRTGRMTLQPNALATSVTVDARTGLATGVRYIDKRAGASREATARVVFLCCGTIETARLMLNSSSARHPRGLANSSGWVGRGLMDHPVTTAVGVLDSYLAVDNRQRSTRQSGLLIPPPVPHREADVRPFGVWVRLQRSAVQGRPQGVITTQGEVLPYWHNRVRLSNRRDRWGMPVPRIESSYGRHENDLYAAMVRAIKEVAAIARMSITEISEALTDPGLNVHELGTARMGSNPTTSVLDADNRCWDCANVFVTDGASFPSAGWQNPALTIMALSARGGRRAATLLREHVY